MHLSSSINEEIMENLRCWILNNFYHENDSCLIFITLELGILNLLSHTI
jgi:hypothetical protein